MLCTASTKQLFNHTESWSEEADILWQSVRKKFFQKSCLWTKRCVIHGFCEHKTFNFDQIKQLMKTVCTISVSISKYEPRFSATIATPKSLIILPVVTLFNKSI